MKLSIMSNRPSCRPGIMVANCTLSNTILRKSRSAMALPRSASSPMMSPSSFTYWIGATVGLIAAIRLPFRISGGRPSFGSHAACALSKATPSVTTAPARPAIIEIALIVISAPSVAFFDEASHAFPAQARRSGKAHHAQDTLRRRHRAVRARRLHAPRSGAGPRRGQALPRKARELRGALSRAREEAQEQIAPARPLDHGDRGATAHPRRLRGPARAQYPLLEHGLADQEAGRRDLRRLASGHRLWRGQAAARLRHARLLRVRLQGGLPARGSGLA